MIGSLIAYVASTTGLSCQTVFLEALARTSSRAVNDPSTHADLRAFANESCKTQNPDALWIIGRQETGFRFKIIRFNMVSGSGKIVEGANAEKAANIIQKKIDSGDKQAKKLNADIGVLQVNLGYHGKEFGYDIKKMMLPETQVRYVAEKFVNTLYKTCGDKWSACYHSGTEWRKAKYAKSVKKIRESLTHTLFTIGAENSGGKRGHLLVIAKGILTPRYVYGRLPLDPPKTKAIGRLDEVGIAPSHVDGLVTTQQPNFTSVSPSVAVFNRREDDSITEIHTNNPIH